LADLDDASVGIPQVATEFHSGHNQPVVDQQRHWERVYRERVPEELGWYEPSPQRSLALIDEAGLTRDAAILDVGGGASGLAGKLLEAGFRDITVVDLSAAALEKARTELGERAARINWVVADAREYDFGRQFDLWHDRALFHFMVEAPDRDGYLTALKRSLRPGGHLVIATFGPEGPTQCSGLPVSRYGIEELSAGLESEFEPVSSELHLHRTPSGREQQFLSAHFRRPSTGTPTP
jgi:SAM-dependent methyltransferase